MRISLWTGEVFLLNCELCGSNIRGEVQVINMDGGVFRVCKGCSKFGTAARVPKPAARPQQAVGGSGFGSRVASSVSVRPRSPPSPSAPSNYYGDEDMMLREDYSKAIKNARELLGIKQDELGMKINEKPSVISHLEAGSIKPTDALARKLEHFLKIQLFVPEEDEITNTGD
jgi:putative transcription factor